MNITRVRGALGDGILGDLGENPPHVLDATWYLLSSPRITLRLM